MGIFRGSNSFLLWAQGAVRCPIKDSSLKYYTPAALCSTRVRVALRPLPTVVPFLIAQPKKCPLVASSSHPAADFRSSVLLYTSKLTGTEQLKVVLWRKVIRVKLLVLHARRAEVSPNHCLSRRLKVTSPATSSRSLVECVSLSVSIRSTFHRITIPDHVPYSSAVTGMSHP